MIESFPKQEIIAMIPKELEKRAIRTGVLELTSTCLTVLPNLNKFETLKTLNISYMPISTLEGIRTLPNLSCLLAEYSNLSTFAGFLNIPNLTSISIKSTPLASTPHFKLALLVLLPHLASIDGKQIPRKLREKAAEYPKEAAVRIEKGWQIKYPCPDLEDLHSENDNHPEEEQHEQPPDPANIEEISRQFDDEHNILFDSTIQAIDNWDDEEQENEIACEVSLCEAVAEILTKYGYKIDPDNLDSSVLNVIQSLIKRNKD